MLFQFCIHYLDCGCLLLVVTPEVLKQRVNGGREGAGRVEAGRVGAGRVEAGWVGAGRVEAGRVGAGRVEDELPTQFLGQHTIVLALR